MTRLLYDPKPADAGGNIKPDGPKLPAGVMLDGDGWPVGDDVIRDASPLRLAEHYATWRRSHHGHHTLLRYASEWWACRGDRCGHERLEDELLAADVWRHLDGLLKPDVNRAGEPLGTVSPFKPTKRQRDDAVEALRATVAQVRGDAPKWIGNNPPDLPPRSAITFRNGILNLDAWLAGSDALVLPDPRWFCPAALPFDFDPEAGEPAEWLAFLDSLKLRDDERKLLQMWAGYLLTPDTSQQKALMLIGPKRSGKGTIIEILRSLVGRQNSASLTLASIASNFGLAGLLTTRLATLPDARLSGRADQAAVVERILSITGEDALPINRKFREEVTAKLDCRLVFASNELPRLNDSSGALASRFLIVPLRRSHLGREDHGLRDRLAGELPGILLWAMQGLAMLRENGRFEQPKAGSRMQRDLDDLGSPVAAFVRDWCVRGRDHAVWTGELYGAWRRWCDEQGLKATPKRTFGRDLGAAVPRVTRRQGRNDIGMQEYRYLGIALKPEKIV